MSDNETMVGVPLKDEVKDALAERANDNGRALGREAAKIIERAVLKKAK